MSNRTNMRRTLILILGISMSCGAGLGFAFDMGNMMNPSKWMGGNKDRDYDNDGPRGGPGYGYGGPSYGYGDSGGYGGPGYGYGSPGGYGNPGYGYGSPGGYGNPGYGYSSPGGYGNPGYGYGSPGGYGNPGYGYGSPGGYGNPPMTTSPRADRPARANHSVYGSPHPGAGGQSEIDDLRERLKALERAGDRW